MTHVLQGSERTPYRGARAVRDADPSETLRVTVLVRHSADKEFARHVGQVCAGTHTPISRETFAKTFSASEQDLTAVRSFARQHGLSIVEEHAARRTVVLSGTVAQFSAAFNVHLQIFEYDGGSYRGRTGAITLPDSLDGVVEAVLGLDNRPQARPHVRPAVKPAASFAPTTLASFYDFPPQPNASGQCIALIELGGGYNTTDIEQYFSNLKLSVPPVIAVSVDGATNAPTGDPNGPDAEVALDIEVAGAVAPGATLAVYFAPNTDAGFIDAITTAIHDTANKPSVLSISWGGPESSWTQQTMQAMDQAFASAATMGITVCVASGDSGSNDGVGDNADHVDFPASSSYVLGCGGTRVQTNNGMLTGESVWNDAAGATGGGVSTVFPLPTWQQHLALTRSNGESSALTQRGVPDVSADADPETGYDVLVDGARIVLGGTSAAAPLWAGLVAIINAGKKTQLGFINPKLYANGAALKDVTDGTNGDYAAAPGWDACTGLGSPDGRKLAGVL